MKTKTEKFKAMFEKNKTEITKECAGKTLQDIENAGKAGTDGLKFAKEEGQAPLVFFWSRQLKVYRCAWYAIRNGWVQS